jgi:hypothetical protein
MYADELDLSPEELEMHRDRILSLGNVKLISTNVYLFKRFIDLNFFSSFSFTGQLSTIFIQSKH